MSHRSFLALGKSRACYIWTSQRPREEQANRVLALKPDLENHSTSSPWASRCVSLHDSFPIGSPRAGDRTEHGYPGAQPVTLLFLTWSGSNGHVQVMPADAHPSDHMHSTKKRRRVPACWCPGFPSFGHRCRSPPPLCPTLCGPMSGRHTMLLCAPRSPGLCSNSRPVSLWGHLTLCPRSFSSPRSCYLMQSKHL